MNVTDKILNHFIKEEGLRLRVYKDHLGFATIGIGHKLTEDDLKNKLTYVTKEEAIEIFKKDIDIAYKCAIRTFTEYFSYPENVRLAILDMIFNLGCKGFNRFETTISLIKQRKFKEAGQQAMTSRWAKQVPNRAKRTTDLLASGSTEKRS
jgi:GH24 family phage-related lysozyme (muramidase)